MISIIVILFSCELDDERAVIELDTDFFLFRNLLNITMLAMFTASKIGPHNARRIIDHIIGRMEPTGLVPYELFTILYSIRLVEFAKLTW